MNLEPISITHLNHRSSYFSGNLVAAQNGSISLLDENFSVLRSFQLEPEIKCVSLDLPGNRFCAVYSKQGKLFVGDFNGKLIFDGAGCLGVETCYFQGKTNLFWCINRITADEVKCVVYDTINWNLVSELKIEDFFADSYFSFREVPNSNTLSLWMAAGQDGQKIFWLNLKEQIIECIEETSIEDTTPPAFNDSGNEFLVTDDEKLYRYEYPGIKLSGTYEYPEDTYVGYSLCFIGNNRAIIEIGQGRIFIVNVDKMQIEDEVIIKGHEPQAVEVYYPNIKGDLELCTDVSYFKWYGDRIVAVYRNNDEKSAETWKDSLLIFDIKQFG